MSLALVTLACGEGFETQGDDTCDAEFCVGTGGVDSSGSGGENASGGESASGGVDGGSGGADLGSGGIIPSSGGAPNGGSGGETGGSGSGGGPTVTTDVLWSDSYVGDGSVGGNVSSISMRLMQTPSGASGCERPFDVAHQFVAGESGTWTVLLTKSGRECLATVGPYNMVAHVGPNDFDFDDFDRSAVDDSDTTLRLQFVLNSFTADAWPSVGGTTIHLDFRWELVRDVVAQ